MRAVEVELTLANIIYPPGFPSKAPADPNTEVVFTMAGWGEKPCLLSLPLSAVPLHVVRAIQEGHRRFVVHVSPDDRRDFLRYEWVVPGGVAPSSPCDCPRCRWNAAAGLPTLSPEDREKLQSGIRRVVSELVPKRPAVPWRMPVEMWLAGVRHDAGKNQLPGGHELYSQADSGTIQTRSPAEGSPVGFDPDRNPISGT